MTTKKKLKSKAFREAYAAEVVRTGIAYQVTALREQRNLSQAELGQLCGKPQSVISRIEDPDYGRLSLSSLIDIASALDVALKVEFVPFSDIAASEDRRSPSDLYVSSFADDQGFLSSKAANSYHNVKPAKFNIGSSQSATRENIEVVVYNAGPAIRRGHFKTLAKLSVDSSIVVASNISSAIVFGKTNHNQNIEVF